MFPGTPNLVARRIGIECVLCIDELISLAQKIDMSRKPVAENISFMNWNGSRVYSKKI